MSWGQLWNRENASPAPTATRCIVQRRQLRGVTWRRHRANWPPSNASISQPMVSFAQFIHSSTRVRSYPPVMPRDHELKSVIGPFTHPCVLSKVFVVFVNWLTSLLIQPLLVTPCIHLFIHHAPNHPFIHPPTHPLICSQKQPFMY